MDMRFMVFLAGLAFIGGSAGSDLIGAIPLVGGFLSSVLNLPTNVLVIVCGIILYLTSKLEITDHIAMILLLATLSKPVLDLLSGLSQTSNFGVTIITGGIETLLQLISLSVLYFQVGRNKEYTSVPYSGYYKRYSNYRRRY